MYVPILNASSLCEYRKRGARLRCTAYGDTETRHEHARARTNSLSSARGEFPHARKRSSSYGLPLSRRREAEARTKPYESGVRCSGHYVSCAHREETAWPILRRVTSGEQTSESRAYDPGCPKPSLHSFHHWVHRQDSSGPAISRRRVVSTPGHVGVLPIGARGSSRRFCHAKRQPNGMTAEFPGFPGNAAGDAPCTPAPA
jgi:hypothetical protein